MTVSLIVKDSGGGTGDLLWSNLNSIYMVVRCQKDFVLHHLVKLVLVVQTMEHGQVLTSNGSGSAVTWEDASGGGGITTQQEMHLVLLPQCS